MESDSPKTLYGHVGSRIRFYRKLKNMTQDQLAAAIHKSESTLSKYESGQISIDIGSLYDIAVALGTDMSQFIDYAIPREESRRSPTNPFSSSDVLHMYYYDGRLKRVIKTMLELQNDQAQHNEIPCRCYMNLASFSEPEKARYFYTGTMNHFDLMSYAVLSDQSNPVDRISLYIMNSFHNRETWGLMTCISYNPLTPFMVKFLLSSKPMPDSKVTPEALTFTKNELKMIKDLNMVLLNTKDPL